MCTCDEGYSGDGETCVGEDIDYEYFVTKIPNIYESGLTLFRYEKDAINELI